MFVLAALIVCGSGLRSGDETALGKDQTDLDACFDTQGCHCESMYQALVVAAAGCPAAYTSALNTKYSSTVGAW